MQTEEIVTRLRNLAKVTKDKKQAQLFEEMADSAEELSENMASTTAMADINLRQRNALHALIVDYSAKVPNEFSRELNKEARRILHNPMHVMQGE